MISFFIPCAQKADFRLKICLLFYHLQHLCHRVCRRRRTLWDTAPFSILNYLPAERTKRTGEPIAAVAVILLRIIALAALALLGLGIRVIALEVVRIGQRDGDIERLAGRNTVYAQRQLVAGLLILLEFVYLIHVRGRGTVNGGDDIADLQALTGCLCAGINGIYLHAGHLAVRGLNVLAGDADGRTAGNVTVLNQLINNILGGVDRDAKPMPSTVALPNALPDSLADVMPTT